MASKMKSKTAIRVAMTSAFLLFVCSFACITICGLLKEHGYGYFWWPLAGLTGFFASNILALILLLSIMHDSVLQDMAAKNSQYDTAAFSLLSNVSPAAVQQQFTAHGFQEVPGGYLRRKMISLTKDSICYYVECLPAENLETTLERAFQRFDALGESAKNICLLLFLFKAQPTADDYALVRKTAKTFIISETLLPVRSFQTCVLVLADARSGQGCYLALQSKGSISLYGHACRLLKKYFAL